MEYGKYNGYRGNENVLHCLNQAIFKGIVDNNIIFTENYNPSRILMKLQ